MSRSVRPPFLAAFLLLLASAVAAGPAAPLPPGFWRIEPDLAVGGSVSAAEIRTLRKAGFRTFLNLQGDEEHGVAEEEKLLAKEPVRYVQVPVSIETVGAAEIDGIRKVVNDPKARPLVVHCRSANRVGMMLAVLAAVDDGATLDEAEKIGVAAGLRSAQAKETFRRLATELRK